MKIPIASDHAGFPAKQHAIQALQTLGYEVVDLGVLHETQVDYPDYAVQVAKAVSDGAYEKGILICGSGQGMCITANKFDKVRAALAWSPEIADLSVRHNNANVLCLPGRFLEQEQLKDTITAWLNAHFEGGRHENRVKKIHDLTNTRC
jgi:ribose 5-phosphate isomerase B